MDEALFFGEDDFDILDIDGYELKPSSFFNKLPENSPTFSQKCK